MILMILGFKGLDKMPLKIWFMVIFLWAVSLFSSAQAAETVYFSALPDIPVMQGLYEVSERTMVFDKAEGRVVEMVAQSPRLPFSDVLSFYNLTLKQLGWTLVREGVFEREGEQLIVKLEEDGQTRVVRFFLSPNASKKF